MVSTVGPVSMRKTPSGEVRFRRPARPPGTDSLSMTVTLRPAPARRIAADRPARPAPTITTLSVAPLTVRGVPVGIQRESAFMSDRSLGCRICELGEDLLALRSDARMGNSREGRGEKFGDQVLGVLERAGVGDDRAQFGDA